MKAFKVDNKLDYKEVELTKVTNSRVYFKDSNGQPTYESKKSNYWGYIYFFSEKEAVNYIYNETVKRIGTYTDKINRLAAKGEEMIKLQKSL